MKIIHKEKIMQFADVSIGTIVRDEMGRISMKISEINTDIFDFDAVQLETGEAYFIDGEEYVTVYPNAELTL